MPIKFLTVNSYIFLVFASKFKFPLREELGRLGFQNHNIFVYYPKPGNTYLFRINFSGSLYPLSNSTVKCWRCIFSFSLNKNKLEAVWIRLITFGFQFKVVCALSNFGIIRSKESSVCDMFCSGGNLTE